MIVRAVAFTCSLLALAGCGARAVDDAPADGGTTIGDASKSPSTTHDSGEACADGGTCTSSVCTCKPTGCPDETTVRHQDACIASSPKLCPSVAVRGCADAREPNRVTCTCTEGRWICFATQFDGDCCRENGACGTSYSCRVPGAGPCGGALLLECKNGTYQRATQQSQEPCVDAG